MAWVEGGDPVAFGEARVESWLYDAAEARRRTRYLLDQLTRDPD